MCRGGHGVNPPFGTYQGEAKGRGKSNHRDLREHGERSDKTVRKLENTLDVPCLLAQSPGLISYSASESLASTFSVDSVTSVVRNLLPVVLAVVNALSGYDLVSAGKNCSDLPRV
jgi:hypothetical protein